MTYSKSDDIYETILNRICLRQYRPGTVLREEDMASEFGVSRTLIRQALQRLQLEGMIESRKRLGTMVTGFSRETTKEMYDIRVHLTDLAGVESHRTYTQEDITAMEALMDRIRTMQKSGDMEEYWAINLDLLHILTRVIENRTLRNLMQMLFYQTARNWAFLYTKMWDEACELLIEELGLEISFMKGGDRRGVFLTMKSFIVRCLQACEKTFENLSEDDRGFNSNANHSFDFRGIAIRE